MLKAEKAIIE